MEWAHNISSVDRRAKQCLQFDVSYEELEPKELEITGNIPVYCAGVLFRNGLGPLSFDTSKKNKTYRTNHWFDCLSQVHRFQIHAPKDANSVVRVTHNSRRTCDKLIEHVQKTGNRTGITFAAKYEPCKSFFSKVQSVFAGAPPEDDATDVNVGVTLSPNFPGFSRTGKKQETGVDNCKIASLFNKTDSSMVQALDPETLEPIGIARQSVLHLDLNGPCSGAHAKVCPKTGDTYNYNLEFGRNGIYRAFHVSAATGKCDILAKFAAKPAYLHSSLLTENYYILCVWNSHFTMGGVSILWNKNFLDSIADFNPQEPARWYVIDRKPTSDGGRGLVATFKSDPFFSFHTINAYEEASPTCPNQVDIIADICVYDNLDVLKRFYVDNMRSDSKTAAAYHHPKYASSKAYFKRFRLPGVNSTGDKTRRAEDVVKGSKGLAPELPSINHKYRGRRYRYVYGATDTGKAVFLDGLVKYDTINNVPARIWSAHGQSAGEPIFIPDPSAEEGEEDKGVLLSAVLDGPAARSYLLVLDARDLTEIGRAVMPEGPGGVIGFGFHGAHVGVNQAAIEASS